jgi:hypothetical protein
MIEIDIIITSQYINHIFLQYECYRKNINKQRVRNRYQVSSSLSSACNGDQQSHQYVSITIYGGSSDKNIVPISPN